MKMAKVVTYRVLRNYDGKWKPSGQLPDHGSMASADYDFGRLLDAIDHVGGDAEEVRLVKATTTYEVLKVRTRAESAKIHRQKSMAIAANEKQRLRRVAIRKKLEAACRPLMSYFAIEPGSQLLDVITRTRGGVVDVTPPIAILVENWVACEPNTVLTKGELKTLHESGGWELVKNGPGPELALFYRSPGRSSVLSWGVADRSIRRQQGTA